MLSELKTAALACLALTTWALPLRADDRTGPTVGMPARIEQVVLPGPELEARPLDDRRAPIVVRIAEVFPHGSSFRYDLIYYGLEPGEFDLATYLRRKDGSAAVGLPKVPVTIRPILPPGQIEPHRLEPRSTPPLGGYRTVLVLIGVAWAVGLVMILLIGRRKHATADFDRVDGPTLAGRLRPMVEAAVAGTLTPGQHAELERLLIGYWRHRLDLDDADPAEAIAVLRRHEEAGPLLRQLEDWLHRPDRSGPVDLAALLEPYRDIPDEPPIGASEPSGRPA